MCMTKTHSKEVDSHSYKHVHDENPFTRKWIVIRTNMYIRKTHSKDMDSHSYKHVHDENPYIRIIWIVIRTNMYMKKTHTKTYVNMDIQSTKVYMTKHTTELISTRKMMNAYTGE